MTRLDIDFESFPRMTFDEDEGCNWNYIMQREVLGPFAPRSGWIAALRKDSMAKGRGKRRNGFLQAVAYAMLDKALPMSRVAKALRKQQTMKFQHEAEEQDKVDHLRTVVSQQEKSERRFKYGQICRIFRGSRVPEARCKPW